MNPVPDHLLETTAAAFIVGDLYLDVGQQRVTRAGSDIALPNLSFRLLVALVRAAPNVLSNDVFDDASLARARRQPGDGKQTRQPAPRGARR